MNKLESCLPKCTKPWYVFRSGITSHAKAETVSLFIACAFELTYVYFAKSLRLLSILLVISKIGGKS